MSAFDVYKREAQQYASCKVSQDTYHDDVLAVQWPSSYTP